MGKRRFVYLAVLGLIWVVFLGCASSGRLRVESGSDTKVFLKDIEQDYDKYIIYANEWPTDEVSAIVFDPKDDNKTIETDGWTKVTSQEQLSRLIKRSDRLIFRQFFKIVGANDDFYGYLLGGQQYVWIKTVDDNTLKLVSSNWEPRVGDRYEPFRF
ncbi:MAG: hypothetical protein HKM90_04390 [Desulfobacteraceae bacterium]|nr:hypothetical protein [Desulfobacteraceae bacterium]